MIAIKRRFIESFFLPPIIQVELIEALNFPKYMFPLLKGALNKSLVDYILQSLSLIKSIEFSKLKINCSLLVGKLP